MTDSPSTREWTSSWHDDEQDKLETFRALSCTDKIRAIEHLNQTVSFFHERAQKRNVDNQDDRSDNTSRS